MFVTLFSAVLPKASRCYTAGFVDLSCLGKHRQDTLGDVEGNNL
jgi:hypothetical protein